jgi:molecular chaperone DnaK (HSP70)
LGIVTTGGHFEVLIPANSRLPACRERIFTTGRDEQKAIKIIVMQGQSTLASGNELLGEFAVSGLPSAPAGGVEVNVAFMIDKEGLFSASATNLATGDEHEIDVIPDAGFDEGEIEHLSAERTMKEDAMAAAEQVEATRQRLDVLLSETGRLIGRARQLPSPSEKVKSTLDKAERLLGLMHRALRGGPTKDMSQEALVLQRTQRTLRAILCGEPSD